MGVWVLKGRIDERRAACLVDSVTMQAFGPIFDNEDEVEAFLEWHAGRDDIRAKTPGEVADLVHLFRRHGIPETGGGG